MFPNGMMLNETYEIRERIGHGGGGAVYAAYDIKLRKLVAIKYLHLEGDHAIKAFGHEASLLANLHHPSLPKVYLHFSTNDGQFLVMDLIDGNDLSTLLERQGGPLPVDQVLGWADQLLSVLTYLHSYYRQPIVHRDIKPANIKITTRGELKLLDFGLAKAEIFTNMRSAMHSVHGYTLTYAPPEQINQEGTDPRSDLYSLGATLYHLLTGRTPTDGDGKTADALARTLALAKRKPDPIIAPKLLNPAIPAHVNQAIMRSLEIDADDRFASAEEFRQILAQPYTPINPAQTQILPTTIGSRAITGPPKQASIRESSQPQAPISTPKSNYPAQPALEPSVQAQPKASAKRFLPLLLGLLLVAAGGGWWLSRDEQTPIVTVSQATNTVVAAQPSQSLATTTTGINVADQPTITLGVATSATTSLAEDVATATEPAQLTTAAVQPTNEPATARPVVQPTNRPATARPAPTNPPALQPTNPPVVIQPTNEPIVQPTNPPAPSDRDGDGFNDDLDGCPDVAGPNNGCPAPIEPTQPPAVTDRDGDTIPDDRDACPNEPGDPSRNGCPKPAEQPTNPPRPTDAPVQPTRVPPTVQSEPTRPPPPPPPPPLIP